MNQKGISVIICCYNSAARITSTLDYLMVQAIQPDLNWEIIIVDNASSDSTAIIAEKLLRSSNIPFQIVTEKNPGLFNARKKGFTAATYDLLLFCDDDNWLAPTYVQRAHDLMREQPSIGMLGGWGSAKFEAEEPFWFSKFQQNFAVGPQSDKEDVHTKVDLVYGAGCTIRYDLLGEIYAPEITLLLSGRTGNKLMSGDDNEWCYLVRFMGYEIAYSPELRFDHYMPSSRMNWEYLKKLHVGFGRTNIYTHAYLYITEKNCVPSKKLRFPYWFDTLIHRIRETYAHYRKIKTQLQVEGNSDVLRYYGLIGEVKEIIRIRKKLMNVYQTALKNKQIIEKKTNDASASN
jgi:glycosyltransferase involved in cell wall biosynthesis